MTFYEAILRIIWPERKPQDREIHCSFCGKPEVRVGRLMQGGITVPRPPRPDPWMSPADFLQREKEVAKHAREWRWRKPKSTSPVYICDECVRMCYATLEEEEENLRIPMEDC
jgi:ClpX C4-type zinc finger